MAFIGFPHSLSQPTWDCPCGVVSRVVHPVTDCGVQNVRGSVNKPRERTEPLWLGHDSALVNVGRDKGKFRHELWARGSGIYRVLLTFVVAWTGEWEWYFRGPSNYFGSGEH